jgi:hypothetical protein
LRLFKEIFRVVEAFNYKCEAFIEIPRLFEEIYRQMEALTRNPRLFKSDVKLFQRIRGFLKLFPDK